MNCLTEEKKAVLFTIGFVLLCCSLLLLFARGSSAAWEEVDAKEYPQEGSAITDFDERSLVEEYKYLGMEDTGNQVEPDNLTLGESSLYLPPDKDVLSGLSEEAQASLLENVEAIRADIRFFLYGVLPVILAAAVLFKGCIWFYRTFISGAFE